MHGMFDHEARLAYARERAETLREVMRASRRRKSDDEAGRPVPAHAAFISSPARLRVHRGSV